MSNPFCFEVVTPERVVFDQPVESLVVPGVEGYLGVLYNHAPMVVHLRIGVVRYREPGGDLKRMAISGGFLEVADNRAVILADTAELAAQIDVMRARAAKERALRRLAGRREEIDFDRAQAALQRAIARLRAVGEE